MKKKTVLKLLFIASCLAAMYSLFYSHETNALDSLAFQINRYQCDNLLYRFPRYLLPPIFDFSQ